MELPRDLRTIKGRVKSESKVLRCPNCGSSQLYFRSRTRDFRCRECGYVFKKNSSF